MRTFHHSTLDSPRMKKVLEFLKQRGTAGATTIEITDKCVTTRASSDISELRMCLAGTTQYVETKFEGTNANGRRVHRYFLRTNETRKAVFAASFAPVKAAAQSGVLAVGMVQGAFQL